MTNNEPKSLDAVLMGGGALKALGDGKVGGYLVKFSAAGDPDLAGDYFTAETDFGKHKTTPVLFEHGLDDVLKSRILDDDATIAADEFGIWVEAQLELRDAYEQFIYGMAEKGKMGWSSGTAAHLVRREPAGKAQRITRWPLGLDASLTLTPMEPRAEAIPLRSYMELPAVKESLKALREGLEPKRIEVPDDPEPEEPQPVSVPNMKRLESDNMEAKEMELIEARFAAAEANAKKTAEALEQIAAATKSVKDPGYAVSGIGGIQEVKERPFKSLGEQMLKVVEAARTGNPAQADPRLFDLKALGLNETIPSEGGFLVQQDFSNELFKIAHSEAVLAPKCRRIPISNSANGIRVNAVAETSRVTGSRWGGVQGYWLNEAGTKLATKPAFRQLDLKLEKLIALCYATDEVLADAVALESIISQAMPEEIAFLTDRAIYSGSGAGQPLGFLNGPALVTVAKESGQAAATVVTENIVKMWARMPARNRGNAIWIINQDVEPSLDVMGLAVGLSGVPSYFPAGGIADAPYGRLKGRPVVITEHNSTLGTLGDIMLVDLSQYLLIDKGLQAASSIHVAFLTDEQVFRFVYRVDGQPMWNSAMTPAVGSNTQSPFVALATRA